jgi:hypothetical protein
VERCKKCIACQGRYFKKRDRHRTSTKLLLGVIGWVHELFKRPSYMYPLFNLSLVAAPRNRIYICAMMMPFVFEFGCHNGVADVNKSLGFVRPRPCLCISCHDIIWSGSSTWVVQTSLRRLNLHEQRLITSPCMPWNCMTLSSHFLRILAQGIFMCRYVRVREELPEKSCRTEHPLFAQNA